MTSKPGCFERSRKVPRAQEEVCSALTTVAETSTELCWFGVPATTVALDTDVFSGLTAADGIVSLTVFVT